MQLWMLVPREERLVIAEQFLMSRTGITEVRDMTVISDGHSETDLQAINVETMRAFVGEPEDSELSFSRLWELTCAKAFSIVHPPVLEVRSREDGGTVFYDDKGLSPEAAVEIAALADDTVTEVVIEEKVTISNPKTKSHGTTKAKGTKPA